MNPQTPSGQPDMRPFPMQDGPPIPWFLAEAIHRHLYRHSQPLDVVARRGGFGWSEVAYMWESRGDRSRGIPPSHTKPEHRKACRAEVQAAFSRLDTKPIGD